MNKIIEKYIYDVTRRLPQDTREDVGNELRTNILEMVQDDNNEEEIKKVLYSLGSPRSLANSYRTTKKHLISSELMSDYLHVLKLVLIILGVVGLVFGLIDALQTHESTNVFGIFIEVVAMVIGNIISILLRGFAIVTIIFILIDNYSERKDVWKVEDLPEPPKKPTLAISRAGSISGLVFTVIFGAIWLYVLYYSNIYFGWVNTDGVWTVEQSLFNVEYTRGFVLLFAITLILDISVCAFKIKYTKWNYNLAILYTFSKVVSVVVSVVFLLGSNLINPDFITKVSIELSLNVSDVTRFIDIFKYSIIGLAIFGNIVDLISMYFKQFRFINSI
ncbi:MAG: hypothetical protein RQ856_00670 [Candidatus Izemoplasmatales bacterium]|nr:hypothetical protein [Candidatus Izemoplasmatales bacterium]